MRIIGVIPSRFSSTRLPGKPLLLIKGKPMIQRVYEQAKKSKFIDEVVVATDDLRIAYCVKGFGGKFVMTSSKHKTGTDRICETIKKISCDIVVNIQGDEPFINPGNIDKAVKPMIDDPKLNVSTLAVAITNPLDFKDVNKVKVVFDKKGYALYFSRSCIPHVSDSNAGDFLNGKCSIYKHIGLYVYRKNYLLKFCRMKMSCLEKSEKLEQLRILENGEKIKVILTGKDSVSVDTSEDLKRVNK